tara:strand:- start:147 stop:563 length:417 start_codon:yes stop_codon:yes gene_type:complete
MFVSNNKDMNHSAERLTQRILNVDTLDIVKETSTAIYTKIGDFKMTDLIKTSIQEKVSQIRSKDFGNRDYAILVHNFGKVVSLHDSEGESNGDAFYAIVRNNDIHTMCFVKSYTGYNSLETKLRVDGVIKKLKNFKKR